MWSSPSHRGFREGLVVPFAPLQVGSWTTLTVILVRTPDRDLIVTICSDVTSPVCTGRGWSSRHSLVPSHVTRADLGFPRHGEPGFTCWRNDCSGLIRLIIAICVGLNRAWNWNDGWVKAAVHWLHVSAIIAEFNMGCYRVARWLSAFSARQRSARTDSRLC